MRERERRARSNASPFCYLRETPLGDWIASKVPSPPRLGFAPNFQSHVCVLGSVFLFSAKNEELIFLCLGALGVKDCNSMGCGWRRADLDGFFLSFGSFLVTWWLPYVSWNLLNKEVF